MECKTEPCSNAGLFYLTKRQIKNDYKYMRLLDDKTYAAIIKLLAQDEKVALFQKLLLAEKVEPAQIQPAEPKTEEVK